MTEPGQDRYRSVAMIGLVSSVSLSCLVGWAELPAVIVLFLAVPGLLCVVYLLWAILRE
ncbi:hypothetical protein [Nonomuraea sp. C10]|uniref:hypothetical protein n=1 Tax=Nonomuraea sp. C10 TaxID=2600577 RepID=UPI00164F46FB|nr:hypothetical protein [Nonomuraea sp. C10]